MDRRPSIVEGLIKKQCFFGVMPLVTAKGVKFLCFLYLSSQKSVQDQWEKAVDALCKIEVSWEIAFFDTIDEQALFLLFRHERG